MLDRTVLTHLTHKDDRVTLGVMPQTREKEGKRKREREGGEREEKVWGRVKTVIRSNNLWKVSFTRSWTLQTQSVSFSETFFHFGFGFRWLFSCSGVCSLLRFCVFKFLRTIVNHHEADLIWKISRTVKFQLFFGSLLLSECQGYE